MRNKEWEWILKTSKRYECIARRGGGFGLIGTACHLGVCIGVAQRAVRLWDCMNKLLLLHLHESCLFTAVAGPIY